MKKIILIINFCFLLQANSQEKVAFKDIYIDNFLAYKMVDDSLFSGQVQRVRKNGHLVYEELFEKGKLKKSITYFNKIEPQKAAQIRVYYENSFDKKKEINYGLNKNWIENRYFNSEGKKTLIEEFENDTLIYRCEYRNNKKHGTEFCLNKDGTTSSRKFINGKKAN